MERHLEALRALVSTVEYSRASQQVSGTLHFWIDLATLEGVVFSRWGYNRRIKGLNHIYMLHLSERCLSMCTNLSETHDINLNYPFPYVLFYMNHMAPI